MNHPTLFDADRMDLGESIDLTIRSLEAYGDRYGHWAFAYSGGKDSTTCLTLGMHLIKTGRIQRPKRITVCYADTRMELPPLAAAASDMLRILEAEGVETRVAVAPMDKRFYVYMLGIGVPPPNNRTFRWCTRQIKIEPMVDSLEHVSAAAAFGRFVEGKYRSFDQDVYEIAPAYRAAVKALKKAKREKAESRIEAAKALMRDAVLGAVPAPHKILMLTGVRQGESAVRDQRIAMSCGKDGAECGQGWYQETLPESLCDTLAPILHWRTCLVWDWLSGLMPREYQHGYPTSLVAQAYGQGEEGSELELNARTGCVGCPLANRDTAIEGLLHFPRWEYLRPLTELRPLYRWLREPAQRLRQPGGERRKDGTLSKNQNRMGPLTIPARLKAVETILGIQRRCNELRPDGVAKVDILNAEEVARIHELIEANTFPQKWDGDEPTGDQPFEEWDAGGAIQGLLLREDRGK